MPVEIQGSVAGIRLRTNHCTFCASVLLRSPEWLMKTFTSAPEEKICGRTQLNLRSV